MHTILIVDDVEVNRTLLRHTLNTFAEYNIIEASNGHEAIEKFEENTPDLILMDIMMPDLDGHQATSILKEKMGDDHVPVIFLTALQTEEELEKATLSGGDDFLSKPYDITVLSSKIISHLRIRDLTKQINIKNKSLECFNEKLIYEQGLVEHFFNTIIKNNFLNPDIIKYHLSSMSVFNGDIFLSIRGPQGGLYMIVGDFSGHGLTAAVGTIPVAMVFHKMVAENASVYNIAYEINSQLIKLLPDNMFFAASIIELNASGKTLSVWMGGMPEIYWFSKHDEFKGIIESQHMPLGILDNDKFDSSVQVFKMQPEDSLLFYSDGVNEAKNINNELFGDDRVKKTLLEGGSERFDDLLKQLDYFTKDSKQNDDITLVELTCKAIAAEENGDGKHLFKYFVPWSISVLLSTNEIKSDNALISLCEIFSGINYISKHTAILCTILKEVYSNSLEHSILNLESSDKKDGEHFAGYYARRDQAIEELEYAEIKFNFNFFSKDDDFFLNIDVRDSGIGYQLNKSSDMDDELHGRGLTIIRAFSEECHFYED